MKTLTKMIAGLGLVVALATNVFAGTVVNNLKDADRLVCRVYEMKDYITKEVLKTYTELDDRDFVIKVKNNGKTLGNVTYVGANPNGAMVYAYPDADTNAKRFNLVRNEVNNITAYDFYGIDVIENVYIKGICIPFK